MREMHKQLRRKETNSEAVVALVFALWTHPDPSVSMLTKSPGVTRLMQQYRLHGRSIRFPTVTQSLRLSGGGSFTCPRSPQRGTNILAASLDLKIPGSPIVKPLDYAYPKHHEERNYEGLRDQERQLRPHGSQRLESSCVVESLRYSDKDI